MNNYDNIRIIQDVNDHRYMYIIGHNLMAGRPDAYTTVRICTRPNNTKMITVIGRELPIDLSVEVVKRYMDNGHRKPNFKRNPL